MIVGFKGENGKLKDLYKELDLKEVKVDSLDALLDGIRNTDGKTVFINYNDLMVLENPTADLFEKKTDILKSLSKSKKNVFLGLTTVDKSLDKVRLDVAICTKINTKDENVMEDIFYFVNSDLPYDGKLSDDKYALKLISDSRADVASLTEVKKAIK